MSVFFIYKSDISTFSGRQREKSTKKLDDYREERCTSHYHTPLGRFSMVSISQQLEWCRCQKGRRWQHHAESFPKMYRSVLALAPSGLSSNRAWKTAPGGCDKHRGIRHIAHNTGSIFFVMLTTIMDEITVNVRVFILTLGRSFYFCPDWYVFIRATIH